jgi:hypothetical protein
MPTFNLCSIEATLQLTKLSWTKLICYQLTMKLFPTPPPTNKEVENAIYKMKNGTAAGTTGVTSDMLEKLPMEAIHYIADIIFRNWTDQYDCPEWHTITLTVLYKGKGKQCDLNNWRGICLKELTAKVISSVVAMRLLTVLGTNNAT